MEPEPQQDRQMAEQELPGAERFPEEERQQLIAKLDEATRKADEYLALLQRAQADFINYRRRAEQQRAEEAKNAKAELIAGLLPVLDNFERALESVPVGAKGLPWVQGVTMIERSLRSILDAEGVSRIFPLGEDFDPWEHEAVIHEETDAYEDGKVIEVLRPGYKMDSKIIRAAQVKVAKAKPAPSSEL